MANNVNIGIHIDEKDALAKLAALHKKSNEAAKEFERLQKLGANQHWLNALQKPIDKLDKLNKTLNQTSVATSKAGQELNKFASHFASKLGAATLAIAGIGIAFNLVMKGLHAGFDFAKESYEKAVSVAKERAGLEAGYKGENRNGDLIKSVDHLANQLLFLGIKMEDTYKAAKTFDLIFPKANQAATHNFLEAAGVMAVAKFHGNMEQASQSLLMIESSLRLGRMPGVLQMKKLGVEDELGLSFQREVKAAKKRHEVVDSQKLENILERVLIEKGGPEAKAMAMADPFTYFNAQMEKIKLTLGKSLITAFQSNGVQNMLDDLTTKLRNFIETLTPAKIAGFLETFGNAAIKFSDVVLAIADWAVDHFGKSQAQKDREKQQYEQFKTGVNPITGEHEGFGHRALIDKAEASRPGLNTEMEFKLLEEYRKNGMSGNLSKETPEIKALILEMDKYIKAFKFDVTNSGSHSINLDKWQKNANKGIKTPDGFNITNETSGVTGNKSITIHIDIKDQIGQLIIQSANLDESLPQIEDKIIECLNDALNSAQSIIK